MTIPSPGRVQVSPGEEPAGGRAGACVADGAGVGVAVGAAVGSGLAVSVGMGVDVQVGGGVDVSGGVAVAGAAELVWGRSVTVGDTDAISGSVTPQPAARIRASITAVIALVR